MEKSEIIKSNINHKILRDQQVGSEYISLLISNGKLSIGDINMKIMSKLKSCNFRVNLPQE